MKKIKVGTLFSGIGAFEHALYKQRIPHEIIFACDNGEVDIELNKITNLNFSNQKKHHLIEEAYLNSKRINYVKKSYLANHNLPQERFFSDVRFFNSKIFKNDIDIIVGGSPCQSFSSAGYQHGLEDTRGTLFYDFAKIINDIKPSIFIFENVRGLLSHDRGKTWKIIQNVFNKLGYHYSFKVLNSKDYGIPQNRNRLFVVGFLSEKYYKLFQFPQPIPLLTQMQDYLIDKYKFGNFFHNNKIPFKGVVENKYFLSEKVKSHVMSFGTKNYYIRPETDLKIARPLLATMHKMHRAGVDNYITYDSKIRRLTPQESLRLMGFDDSFKQVVSDTQMYKQAGNSIVVDVLEHLFLAIIKTGWGGKALE
jgi:DNA (cytosine-5)-methyltransferase 1